MGRKQENRRNMANNQVSKVSARSSHSVLSSHDFEEFIDEMLSKDKALDDTVTDTPICHVY